MKQTSKVAERVRTVLFMFVITFVFMTVVSSIHLATKDTVEKNASLYLKRTILLTAGMKQLPDDADTLLSLYAANVAEFAMTDEDPDCFRVALKDSAGNVTTSYVLRCKGAGLWGTITAIVGLDGQLETFTGVTFLEHNETPGLGARISEPWFQDQFAGKTGPFSRVPEDTNSHSPTEFDAITGATITSTAVEQIMNRAKQDAPGYVQRMNTRTAPDTAKADQAQEGPA